jgi:hypothetical protein
MGLTHNSSEGKDRGDKGDNDILLLLLICEKIVFMFLRAKMFYLQNSSVGISFNIGPIFLTRELFATISTTDLIIILIFAFCHSYRTLYLQRRTSKYIYYALHLQLSCIRFGTLGPFIKTNHVST